MITLKLASKLLLVAVPIGAGIWGVAYLMTKPTNNSKTTSTPETENSTERRIKSTLRNYLIQLVDETETSPKLTCELITSCKLFSRDTSLDKSATNLKTLTTFADLAIDAYYVLSIDGQDLKEGDLVSITLSDQAKKFKVITSMSYNTDNLKIPKTPAKLLTKDKWINWNGFKTSNPDAFDQLKNRFFINQAYPTHIEWEGINHKKYLVLKWSELVKGKKLHSNKKYMSYFPKDAETKPNKDWQKSVLENKKTSAFSFFQHPFDAGFVEGITDLDKKIDTVDTFLFKPFDTQKEEADEVGSLEVKIVQHTGETLTSDDQITKIIFEHESNTALEIYEIADQANIAKAFSSSESTAGKANLVDWNQIDKDGKMITKASEMKDGHYYKFVFEDESFMDTVFKQFWTKLDVILHNKKVGDSDITKNYIFTFSSNSDDLYCYRTPQENKCLYFQQIDNQMPNPSPSGKGPRS